MPLLDAFSTLEASWCGALVNAAYGQCAHAAGQCDSWSVPRGTKVEASFSVQENGQTFPFGLIGHQGDDLFVAFRGTRTPLEWYEDATILPAKFLPDWGMTTQGFMGIHEQIFPQISGWLLDNAKNFKRLFVTGHSLGAAIANLCAASFVYHRLGPPLRVYTFSGPRVGCPIFAAKFKASGFVAYRVFNSEDIVPTLPLSTVVLSAAHNLGLFDSTVELVLKLILKGSKLASGRAFLFQHVDAPIALTYNAGDVAANHDLDLLLKNLQLAYPVNA